MHDKKYYAIVGTSRYAGDVRWSITYNSEADIIGYANTECRRRGESLEELAGIDWIGVEPDEDGEFTRFEPERPFVTGEEFKAALEKLNDDGRTYSIFDSARPEEVEKFIDEAASIGLGAEARSLVSKFA